MDGTVRPVRVEIIAKLFGVSVRRIQQITQEGIIETVDAIDEKGKACRRYDLIPTIKQYIQYLSDKANGKKRGEKEAKLKEQKLQAEIALKESQVELHSLKTKIAKGEYVSIEEITLDYARFFTVFKKFAMSLPSRLAWNLNAYADPLEVRRIEKDIQADITKLLKSFVVAGVEEQKE